jgi:putative endonuclease
VRPDARQLRQRAGRQGALTRDELGRRAELAVADYLVAGGFVLLARNVRVGKLELDLVARKGPLVAVVEVRTRGPGALERPFESIGPEKRRRLLRAVERLWDQRLKVMTDVTRVRIDVAAVSFDDAKTTVEYVAGAIVP